MQYKLYRYKGSYDEMTQESFEDLKAELLSYDESNQKIHTQAVAAFHGLLDAIGKLYGLSSNEYKYFRQRVPAAPKNHKREIENIRRGWQAAEERKRQRIRSADYRDRSKEVIEQLTALGYEPGKDFSPSSAITFARRHADEIAMKTDQFQSEIEV